MKQYLLGFCALLVLETVSAQDLIRNYVRNNVSRVRSINVADTNYSDLAAFGKAIGDARIVMLGEQDQGDAPTFRAKARLIRYLHEKQGFNVLVFESDFYGLTSGMDKVLAKQLPVDSLIKTDIFYNWTGCNECYDAFRLVSASQNTSQPIKLAGMDYIGGNSPQGITQRSFKKEFMAFLDSTHIPFTNNDVYRIGLPNLLDNYLQRRSGPGERKKTISALGAILDTITLQLKDVRADAFWLRLTKFFKAQLDASDGKPVNLGEQMALNLAWLASSKYSGEKILVWAPNLHIAKGTADGIKPMAAWLEDIIGDQIYSLGFTSLQGQYGTIQYEQKNNIAYSPDNSFEKWLDNPAIAYAFVDLNPFMQGNPAYMAGFYMSAEVHDKKRSGDWPRFYDGIFFIRDMYPCTLNEEQRDWEIKVRGH